MYDIIVKNNGTSTTLDISEIESAKVTREKNKSDSFDFEVSNNLDTSLFVAMQTLVTVKDDEEIIFRGRITDVQTDLYRNLIISCEGALSYLNDTLYAPFEFSGSPNDLLADVLDNHNANVEDDKRIYLGEITVEDSNDYISRSSESYLCSLEVINTRLVEGLDGYLVVRYEDDLIYLDYLAELTHVNDQPIKLGSNLIDVNFEYNYQDVITRLIPLGATDDETSETLDISSVNNGVLYIDDVDAQGKYGIITGTNTWDDVTVASNLLTKAKQFLANNSKAKCTISINAIDLNMIDSSIEKFHLGDWILVDIPTHDIYNTYQLTKIEYDILEPQNSTITLGDTEETSTSYTRSTVSSISSSLTQYFNSISAIKGSFTSLSATVATINEAYISSAEVKDLISSYAYITTADVETLLTEKAYITTADVETLLVGYATVSSLNATVADITNLFADYATIEYLNTNYLTTESLDANYANIDFANIGEAAIENFYAVTGFIKDITVEDGTYTGTLHAVNFEADSIYANSIVLKGEDGLFYKLNTDGVTVSAEQTEYNALSGTILIAQSVTADKIYVSDLYAFDATIGGFIIDENAIRSEAKGTIDATTSGLYMDNSGQFNFGDSESYVKGYYDEDGNYKLEISVSSLYMSTGKNIAETLDETVISTAIYYGQSSSSDVEPTSWSKTCPEWADGYYIWQKIAVVYGNGTVDESVSCITGATGATGAQGEKGEDGESITITANSITYQASDSGTDTPTGDWTETIPTISQGQYLWTRTIISYSDDTSTVSYSVSYISIDGEDGENGEDAAIASDTEPEDTSKLWLDTSEYPYVLKQYLNYTYTVSETDDDGNVISTEEYIVQGWYAVNDQSDELNDLNNKLDSLSETVDDATSAVDSLNDKVNTTNETVSTLSDDVNNVLTQLGDSSDLSSDLQNSSVYKILTSINNTLQSKDSYWDWTFNSMYKIITGGTYTYLVEEAGAEDYTVDDDGYLMTAEGIYIYDTNGNQIIATIVYKVTENTIDIPDDAVATVQEGSYTLDGLPVYNVTVETTSTVTTTNEETGEEVTEEITEENTYAFCYKDIAGAINDISALESLTTEMQSVISHIILGDDNGTPYISLSTTDSDFSLRITNEQISFIEGDNIVAYISENKLWITEAEVNTMTINSELNMFNNFSWININGYFVLVKESE